MSLNSDARKKDLNIGIHVTLIDGDGQKGHVNSSSSEGSAVGNHFEGIDWTKNLLFQGKAMRMKVEYGKLDFRNNALCRYNMNISSDLAMLTPMTKVSLLDQQGPRCGSVFRITIMS